MQGLVLSPAAPSQPVAAVTPASPPALSVLQRYGQLAAVEHMEELVDDVLQRLVEDTVGELNRMEGEEGRREEEGRVRGALLGVHDVLKEFEAAQEAIRLRWVTTQGEEAEAGNEPAWVQPSQLRAEDAQRQGNGERGLRVLGALDIFDAGASGRSGDGALEEALKMEGWSEEVLQAVVAEVVDEVWGCLDGVVDELVEEEVRCSGPDTAAL